MSFLDRVRTVLKQFILEYEKIHKEKKGTIGGFVGNTFSSYFGGADSLQIEQTCETLKVSFNNANSPNDIVELLLDVGRTSYKAQNLKLVNSASDLTKNLNALRNYLLLQIEKDEQYASESDNFLRHEIKVSIQNKIKEIEIERVKKKNEWFKRIENKDQQHSIIEAEREYYAIIRDLAYLGDDFHLLTSGQVDKIFPALEYPSDYHKLNAELDRKNQHTLNLRIPSIFQLAYAEHYVKEELKKVLGENAKLEDLERRALKELHPSNVQPRAMTSSASASSPSSPSQKTEPLEHKDTSFKMDVSVSSMAPQLIDPRVLKQFIVEYEKKRQRKLETSWGRTTNLFSSLIQNEKSLKIDETCQTFKEKFASDVTPEKRIKNLLKLGRTSWLAQKLKFANHIPDFPGKNLILETNSDYCKALNAARNYVLLEILNEPLPKEGQPLNTHYELNNVINSLEKEREDKLLNLYNAIQNSDSNENIKKAQDEYDATLRDLAYLGKTFYLLTSGRLEQIFPGLEYTSDSLQASVDSALNLDDVHKANPNIPAIFQLLYVEIYIRNELKNKLGEEATLQRFILAAQKNPDNDSELPNYVTSDTKTTKQEEENKESSHLNKTPVLNDSSFQPAKAASSPAPASAALQLSNEECLVAATSALSLTPETGSSTTANILGSLLPSAASAAAVVTHNNAQQFEDEEYPNDFIEEATEETDTRVKTPSPMPAAAIPMEFSSYGEDDIVEFEASNVNFSNSPTPQSPVTALTQFGINKASQKKNKPKGKNTRAAAKRFR